MAVSKLSQWTVAICKLFFGKIIYCKVNHFLIVINLSINNNLLWTSIFVCKVFLSNQCFLHQGFRSGKENCTALSFHSYHVPEFLVWGKKQAHIPPPPPYIPPTPLHLGVCTTHQLTDQLVEWLIGRYRWGSATPPAHAHCTQTPSVFTSLRITNVKSVYYSFYPQGGWVGQFFFIQLEFCQFIQLSLHVVFAWQIKSSDRKHSVLFPVIML